MNRLLWVLQILLALIFLFAGVEKELLSAAQLTGGSGIPAGFLRGIGILEILGAIGLVLPGMLHIRAELTALAAACLTVIMIGAVIVTVRTMGFAMAAFPFVTGLFVLFVAYARWQLAPLEGHRREDRQPSTLA